MTNIAESWTKSKAFCFTSHTLVGYDMSAKFPREHGNCFSVMEELLPGAADDIKSKPDDERWEAISKAQKENLLRENRIVNFNHENMEELLERGVVQWPIDILVVVPGVAVIHDARIPASWYDKYFCPTCCPTSHLPVTQHLNSMRDIESGRTTITPIPPREEEPDDSGIPNIPMAIKSVSANPPHRLMFMIGPRTEDQRWYFVRLEHYDRLDLKYWAVGGPFLRAEAQANADKSKNETHVLDADSWQDAIRKAEKEFGGHDKSIDEDWPTMSLAQRKERYGH